jgi:hypothetical protein
VWLGTCGMSGGRKGVYYQVGELCGKERLVCRVERSELIIK